MKVKTVDMFFDIYFTKSISLYLCQFHYFTLLLGKYCLFQFATRKVMMTMCICMCELSVNDHYQHYSDAKHRGILINRIMNS